MFHDRLLELVGEDPTLCPPHLPELRRLLARFVARRPWGQDEEGFLLPCIEYQALLGCAPPSASHPVRLSQEVPQWKLIDYCENMCSDDVEGSALLIFSTAEQGRTLEPLVTIFRGRGFYARLSRSVSVYSFIYENHDDQGGYFYLNRWAGTESSKIAVRESWRGRASVASPKTRTPGPW